MSAHRMRVLRGAPAALVALVGWVTLSATFAPAPARAQAADAAPSGATAQYKIVTASERGTYIQIGRDLAKLVAPAAQIDLEVLPSAGSAENVERLRYEAGVKLAMVQSDVYQAFIDLAAAGHADAGQLIKPLRVVMPLYNEEIYFVARADSPLNYIHEIKDAKINVGPLRSGTAMTATTLYRQMFGVASTEGSTTFLTNEEALIKLTGDKSVDVVVIVAGQPAKLLADMKPEARELIKLLKVDRNNPATRTALKTYFAATVRASSYPALLAEDVPALAVKAFLVTYDYRVASTTSHLRAFAQSLCRNFGQLRSQGHPKWQEVELKLPELGQRWSYSPITERTLRSCAAESAAPAKVKTDKPCAQTERVLGLCS